MSQLKFTLRSSPVLAEHRTVYKIAQVLLILHYCCRSSHASLPKLQLFNWGLKSDTRKLILLNAAQNNNLDIPTWGFDPLLTIAVNFAIADNLISTTSTGYQITEKGSIYANAILEDIEIMQKDKTMLKSIGKGITESMIETITKSWTSQ